jgi:hypothetical protein
MMFWLVGGETQTINLTETVGMIINCCFAFSGHRCCWQICWQGEPLNTLLAAAVDAALLIAVRERLAHLDNGRLVSLLRTRRVPVLGVVENMTHVLCPRCGELIELYPTPVSEQPAYNGAAVLGSIPFHPHLIRQPEGGPPLPLNDLDSPARVPLLSLADMVLARIDDLPHSNGKHRSPDDTHPDDDCIDCP